MGLWLLIKRELEQALSELSIDVQIGKIEAHSMNFLKLVKTVYRDTVFLNCFTQGG